MGFVSLEVCRSMIIGETVFISMGFVSLEVCRKYDYGRDGLHFLWDSYPWRYVESMIMGETVFIFYGIRILGGT